MVQTKEQLKVDGDHSKLGREFNMHEFKGFTVAKIDSIEKTLCRMENNHKEEMKLIRERFKSNEEDIDDLKEFKTKVWSISVAIGLVASGVAFVGNLLIQFLINLWR